MTGRGSGFDAWEESYRASPQSLSIVRLLFGATLLFLLLPRFQWIAGFPDSFFNPPPGLTSGFTGFPPRTYFIAVDVILIAAAVFLTAGRHVTLASVLISGGLLAGDVWAYSFGKITHDILLVVLPLFLAAAGWDGRTSRARPMALLALVVSLAMATGAWQKIQTGWLDLSASAVLGHSATSAVTDGESAPWRLALRLLPRASWELMDYVTVGFESAFILLVARASAFRALCGLACFFHVVVAGLMRITFVWNIPAYAAFVDWEPLLSRARLAEPVDRLQRWLSLRGDLPLLAASSILCGIYLRWGSPLRVVARVLGPEYEILPRTAAILIAALTVATLVGIRLAGSKADDA
jgi:hypothetical protein